VLIVTFLLQQVENYWLTPRMMSEGSDFDPLLVVIFVSMGFTLGGIMGALLSIPVAGTASDSSCWYRFNSGEAFDPATP